MTVNTEIKIRSGFFISHFVYLLQLISIEVLFLLLITFSAFAQPSVKNQVIENGFILSVPSTDCINCKARGIDYIEHIKKTYPQDSILILTNNDAGAYYFETNKSTYGDYQIMVNPELSKLISPKGKSALAYKIGEKKIIFDLQEDFLMFDQKIKLFKEENGGNELNSNYNDSIYLKYNVFELSGNHIFETATSTYFLFSKYSNIGTYLSANKSGDTSSLFSLELSNTKYDSLYSFVKANEHSNMPQEKVREFCLKSGIPIAKIFQVHSSQNRDIILLNFLSCKSDTIIEGEERNINQNFRNNPCLMQISKIDFNNSINIEEFSPFFKLSDSFEYKNNFYRFRSLAEFCLDKNYIYLPVGKLDKYGNAEDNIFYLAQFDLKGKDLMQPINLFLYKTGNYVEDGILRVTDGKLPILVNRIKRCIDFGENSEVFYLNNINYDNQISDSIDYVFDIQLESLSNIQIIASTKSGKLIKVNLVNQKKLENVEVIETKFLPIHVQFLKGKKIAIISKNGHYLFTKIIHYS